MRFLLPLLLLPLAALAAETPNVVILNVDDLGYGDVGCYGAKLVQTPHVDQLAAEGLRFTDAHTTASTCTPSRFSLMTGLYPFRQPDTSILRGDARLIIKLDTDTLPGVFKKAGYQTAAVGKWHLGLGAQELDWNGDIKPGPLEIGFTYDFILPATGDRVPCVYVENRRVVGLDPKDPLTVSYKGPLDDEPTGRKNPELLKVKYSHGHDETIVNGISRIGFMKGGLAARWVDEDMADTLTGKAVKFVEDHQAQPFFLYFATHDIHVPRVPHQRFVGTTPMGPRGDVIGEVDWAVGQIMATLDRLKLTEKTIFIFTSDNGPVLDDGYMDNAVIKLGDHLPAGPWRGGKYSAYEGGTRVPFIVRWPGHIKPGVSSALVSQVDLTRSFATLLHQTLAPGGAPDSQDVLPALLGQSPKGRDALVESGQGVQCLRLGDWKLIGGAGGGNPKKAESAKESRTEQLYDLAKDPGETRNLLKENPTQAATMEAELKRIKGEPSAK